MDTITKYIALILFSLLTTQNSLAQYYSTGQDPASAKWKQIKTDNFQVIFQAKFESQAQKVANILEYNYVHVGNTLNRQPKKISVILHNQTLVSNGYVAWAPKRVELYTSPAQDAIPDPWLESLCVHEQRHVVQIDKLNQGITKILSIVFGQQATGLVAGQLPLWYYEGDAVCTETAFSKFGRGRIPSFERDLKTHLLSDEKRYSFDKMLFGSYKDYVPNHYQIGYQITAYARNKYGATVWNGVENYVAKNSYTLLPTYYAFYRGLKKSIGLSQKQLFSEAFNYLDSTWSYQLEYKNYIEPKYFQSYDIKDYENYINPIVINNDNIIALKEGMSHIPEFVLVNKNSEQVIFEPGYLISNDFSYANNVIVWAEYKPDIRWQNREFTSIKMINIKTKREMVLAEKSRYFSPAFSPNAEDIAVVEADETNKSSLVILNAFNGSVINKIKTSENHFIQRPQWSDDGKSIYVIELTNSGKQVSRYNFNTDKWEFVFKLDNADIQRIIPSKDYIFFHSTINGTDNIYVFDEKTKDIYQISESKYGISEFSLSANNNTIITNEYTSQGLRIAKIPIERAVWSKVDTTECFKFKFAEVLTEQEAANKSDVVMKHTEFQVKPYRKPIHLFNFHSWLPFYVDYNNIDLDQVLADPSEIYHNVHPGVTLISQNKLSTTEAILGYAYKNGNHYLSSSLKFKGQYPVVTLSANYGGEQFIQTTSNAIWYPKKTNGYTYDLDIYIPFNLSKGKFIKGFRPLFSVQYDDNYYYHPQTTNTYNPLEDYYIKGLEFVESELFFYSYERKAERDIIPKLGAMFDFRLFNTPFESELFGYMYNADAVFYLPGRKNSGFKVNFGYQYQKPNLYLFNSHFDFPRGIQKKRTEKMVKLYLDYVFPVSYPDWNLGSLIYLKRIRGDLFADYAYNTFKTINSARTAYIWPVDNNFSFGLELTADYHLLRTMFPLNTGIRIGFAPTENKMIVEMLFGIDLQNL